MYKPSNAYDAAAKPCPRREYSISKGCTGHLHGKQ
jgi:hypothetical protein